MRAAGWHRNAIGNLWEEIGLLQLDFLVAQGLQPHHQLLDIGCGALRGGVRLVPYLEPGNYCGVDASAELLAAGKRELELIGGQNRRPVLHQDDTFDLGWFGRRFDIVLAHSLFTHLNLNAILLCVVAVSKVIRNDGRFFATFFENPHRPYDLRVGSQSCCDGATFLTFPDSDPYHYDFDTLRGVCESVGMEATNLGDWGHPRSQKMMLLRTGDRTRSAGH